MDQEGEKAAEGTGILLIFHWSFLLLTSMCCLIFKYIWCRERCSWFLACRNEEQWSASWGGLCFLFASIMSWFQCIWWYGFNFFLWYCHQITERDEGALKYLKDIKWHRIEDPKGFKLEFFFDSNPYFKNYVLTKTYHMIDEDEPILEKAIG